MATGKTVIKFGTGTDIKIAIQFAIDAVRDTQEDHEFVYNDWFKMTITPTTTLQYVLNLFFSKSMLQKNLGMGQQKINQSIYRNKMLGWNK